MCRCRYVGTNEAPHPKDEIWWNMDIWISNSVENVCRKCTLLNLILSMVIKVCEFMRLKTVAKVGIFLRHAGRGEEHSPGGGWAECCSLSEVMNLKWNKILLVTFFGECNGIFIKYLARCRVAFGGVGRCCPCYWRLWEHCSSVTVYTLGKKFS